MMSYQFPHGLPYLQLDMHCVASMALDIGSFPLHSNHHQHYTYTILTHYTYTILQNWRLGTRVMKIVCETRLIRLQLKRSGRYTVKVTITMSAVATDDNTDQSII